MHQAKAWDTLPLTGIRRIERVHGGGGFDVHATTDTSFILRIRALPGSQDVPAVGTTMYVIQYIQQVVSMPEMVNAIGEERAGRIRMRAQGVHDAFAMGGDPKAVAKVTAAVRDLAKVCLRLRAFNVSALVAETICAAIAAVAGLMEPGFMPGGQSLGAMEALKVMQEMAKDMDGFGPHLNGGLRRSDAATSSGYANASTQRIHAALSGICAWLLTAFCRAVGYNKLTADILWEWTNCDPLWVAVLAKGSLTVAEVVRAVPDSPLTGPFFPPELDRINTALTGAILGLSTSQIAFQDLRVSMGKDDEVDEVSAPNVKFAKHWAKLAMAIAETDLVLSLIHI